MTTQLGYSMFHDVMFPPATQEGNESSSAMLTLRRLKRSVLRPDHPFRESPLIVFDLETTGLDFEVDRIIEVGAIKLVNFEPVEEFSFLVSTNVELTSDIIKLTGITSEMLVGQPSIDEVLPKFLKFIEGGILVAHNAEFDINMIRAACSRLGLDLEWPCFCTLKMARELLADLENKKLDTLAAHYGLSFEARHRAIGDIKVTVGVLTALLRKEGAALQQWSQMQNYVVS